MAIYLDYNATAPLRPEVSALMGELLGAPLNASSVHGQGRHARKLLDDARALLAECFSVFPNEIIFTASATEANATALCGFPQHRRIVSAIEHSSVLAYGADAACIPVDANGVAYLEALERMLKGNAQPALVSLMLANNETGVIQPVAEAARLVHAHSGLLHCDAVQGVGKIPVDAGLLGADLITVSGHKCGGPVGAAALIVRDKTVMQPLLKGGGQELRRRAGTENIPAIAGFAKAVELAQDTAHMQRLRGWLDGMEASLPGAVIIGKNAPRLPNTSCIARPGMGQELQLMKLDLAGFAVSAGSACSSGRIEPSHVLSAMGLSADIAGSAIRISGGWATVEAEIRAFAKAWEMGNGR